MSAFALARYGGTIFAMSIGWEGALRLTPFAQGISLSVGSP